MKKVIRKPNMAMKKTAVPVQEPKERVKNYNEVELGYTEEQARTEAERCMNCPAKYCKTNCPVHVPVPDFIAKVREGDYEAAYQIISTANVIPAISSRVCPQEHQCECSCTRAIKGEAVAVGKLERFVADWHRKNVKSQTSAAPSNCKKVAVVGGGPAGLTCAVHLAAAGCKVTVFEEKEEVGGIAVYGIPQFVLPRDILASYLDRLNCMGAVIKTNMALEKDFTLESLKNEGYDAIFLAIGAGTPVTPAIDGVELNGVVQACEYLASVSKGEKQAPCRNVLVVGGGNTAIDAARTAVRCGAEKVYIMYRRTEAEMPARAEEVIRAAEEGVEFLYLCNPVRFEGDAQGRLTKVESIKMGLTTPDYPGGRCNVAPVAGSNFSIEVDKVILALGFKNIPVKPLVIDGDNRILVKDDDVSTSMEGVFAGGDAVTGPSTLIKASAAGKKAAEAILEYLGI